MMMRNLLSFLMVGLIGSVANAQDNLGDLLQDRSSGGGGGGATALSGPGPVHQGSRDTDTMFVDVARQFEKAVALVVAVVPQEGGGYQPFPFGTAWAFAPNLLGTNSHISQPAHELMAKGIEIYVIPNRSRGESYRVINAVVHPRYAEQRPNAQGRTPTGIPFDVGILQIEGQMQSTISLASQEKLLALDSGVPLAYLGFPTENLQGGNVNTINPIATMQTGNITSMSDYYLEDTGAPNNRLIRHNMPATGGSSGSPVFISTGEVVGVVNAGNIIQVLWPEPGTDKVKIGRAPSAAGVNFAQRVDILYDMLDTQ